MTSLFPASPGARRTEVQVFQVDHGSVFNGILNGYNLPDERRRPRSSLGLGGSSLNSSPLGNSSDHTRSPRKSPKRSSNNKAKLVLSQEDKKRLLVGSDLVSKKKTTRRSAVANGIQQYFAKK